MSTTHALLPLAGALAFAERPIAWRLFIAASIAAAAPDVDGVVAHFWHTSPMSIWSHRGATHSLAVALVAGLLAAFFHRQLRASRLMAGVIITAAMASHGLLDMMTDAGRPVAYLWPLSSVRLFADWRPIHSGGPVHLATLGSLGIARLGNDFWQLIVPMFALALVIRGGRRLIGAR